MAGIKGIIVPIVTPFREDETINTAELRCQVDRQIEAGIHAIFCFGTNGEGYILDKEDKMLVLATVINQVAGRVPVYAGTGCVSTKETIEQSKMAADLGADVLSIITPSFAKASQAELQAHYEAVAAAVDLPIVLYNIPMRTGNALEPATVAKLSEVDNIVGAKDSSGDWDNLKAYIDLTRNKDFAVLSGNDALILRALKEGAKGSIAGCANVYPKNMVGIYENFVKGDLDAAQQCQDNVANLRSVFKYGNPNTVVKFAVRELGFPVGRCRAPFNQLSEEGLAALRTALAEDKQRGIE
ncbi:4-hydroxy-tetrahydrodipicolinate synthase [Olsenella profusa]|uniref:4-hydroxy-tetrahydrodipicolinate synthase n=1 Tax=Olsenella profusa F0195 TaxID=1125712 RepID=U2T111_9ACTN|nr:4-hydroxy-tetrahydrodipicolinate synthase [Olsenella profusa]ERL06739.1 4-hydroxy-tetrahydrodipicolinate synthase [Olsenella profusa F0195]